MKVRALKLREAHKAAANGGASFCSVLWDQKAEHLVTASSSDPGISIHDHLIPSNAPKILRHHRDGVTALALSPNSTCLASGSVDHSVKLYKFPSGEFQTNITRFTLPIRVVAFNKSGSMLAAAGDDEGIKLINSIDGSIARVLKGHRGPVTGLDFDPNGEYLASIDSVGTVIYWELQSGIMLHTLKGVAPDTGFDTAITNIVSWSPDGETLAVPGLKNDLVMYDRDTAEKLFSMRGDHAQPICFFSWSPNGKYMATSSLDRQVLIWNVGKKQDIDRQKFDDRICCMAWKPIGNALALIDVMGRYGIWESVVPSSMTSPTEGIPSSRLKNSNGLLLFDEEDPEPSGSGSLSEHGEDSLGESEPPSRKRLRKQSVLDEDLDMDVDDEESWPSKTKSQKKTHHLQKENPARRNDEVRSTIASTKPKMQEPFQSGATPSQAGKRRFLCYNMLGSITTTEHDGFSHIEAVALGSGWVAAVTSLNFLRIFTEGGLQKHVLSLDGPVVTASGFKDELAVVTHVSDCLPSNEQMLESRVFNVSNGTQSLRSRLPLTPGSYLTWFGFSEEGQLSSYDSKDVLRVFTSQYGGSWLPLFSASRGKQSGESYWVVGLNSSKLFCVVCKDPDLYPQVMPKPILTLLNLSFPLASSDLGADTLENEFMLKNMHLSEIQKRMDELAAIGLDTTKLDDEAFNLEVALDQCILKLIGSCCNGDKLVRATELVKLLSLEKSVRAAIKLVTKLKLPNLAERFSSILEERLLKESMETLNPLPSSKCDVATTTRDEIAGSKVVTSTERSQISEPLITSPSPLLLAAPIFKKKTKPSEGIKLGKEEKAPENQDENVKNGKIKKAEAKDAEETKKVQPQRPSNPFIKSSINMEKVKIGEENQDFQLQRPSNPFLKSTMK
ncbi:WD repeat and HMG-box DNA-binding protein 1 [Carica papaya]|uniref:WD repeat and HMG-box DNA-binding protein 1 n=1 Tax=Carica papaya TaxID=3649 RepID=UPI000B8CAC8F|nr:WD repeat and HMG-box DNA-binding protein 1 [Carica papaya]